MASPPDSDPAQPGSGPPAAEPTAPPSAARGVAGSAPGDEGGGSALGRLLKQAVRVPGALPQLTGLLWAEAPLELRLLGRTLLQAAAVEELSEKDLGKRIALLEKQMLEHARNLEFEQAARTRDQLALLKQRILGAGPNPVVPAA